MTDAAVGLLLGFNWFVLAYFVALNTIYLVLVIAAGSSAVRGHARPDQWAHDDIFANPLTPAVSVLVPAHNEEAGIVESTRAMLSMRYPEFEVVVIDDGSSDRTFELLQEEFDLVETAPALDDDVPTIGAVISMHIPRSGAALIVVRKQSAGKKADALNVGINAARHPLLCMVDADSLLEEDALLRVARPFVDDPGRVVATGGVVRAANGSTVYRGRIEEVRQPRSWLARIQIVEYLRSFLVGRTGWSRFGGLLIVSGAFGLFRRDIVVELGGLDHSTLGEDADLVASIHRRMREADQEYRVVYVSEPVCWTEVPTSFAVLARQRRRWSHGLAEVLWKHKRMIGNPRYGRMGTVVTPYFLVFELLGPVIELFGLVALVVGLTLGVVNAEFALLFASVALLYGIMLSIAALCVEEFTFHRYERWTDLGIGAAAAVLENIGYRQLHSYWRFRGLIAAVRGRPTTWGAMERTGFGAPSD